MGFPVDMMWLQDVRATTVDGQNTVTTATITLNINTEQKNTITGASLAANQVTLPAGTYYISAMSPTYKSNAIQMKWYNVTDAAVEVLGLCVYGDTLNGQPYAKLIGVFVITGTKVFELRSYSQNNVGGGYGQSHDEGGDEVYRDILIEQLAVG